LLQNDNRYYCYEMITEPKYKFSKRQIISYSANTFFIGLICLFLFVPDAKSWVMKQMLNVGFFKADGEKTSQDHTQPLLQSTSLTVKDTKGNTLSINELKGKIVFINFWATWCPPCRAEMPQLQKMYTVLKGNENIIFLFISEDDEIDKANAYFKENNYDLPLYATTGTVQPEIYQGTLPTTLVLGKDGTIAYKHEGIANYNTKEFKNFLESIQ